MNQAIIVFELVFAVVVVFGFGAWQLRSVNREIARDRRQREEAQRAKAPHARASPAAADSAGPDQPD